MRQARQAIGRGDLVIVPTDTVYGVAADAFSAAAVAKLLAAKGRDRTSPTPVLIANRAMATALAEHLPASLDPLLEMHWPGPLTVIARARPSLGWDLGDTNGTVALRIPANPLTTELLEDTGPLAVSSANLHGMPAPHTAARAAGMIGGAVAVVLDAGEVGEGYEPHEKQNGSTIIDASRDDGLLRIVRQGVLSEEAIRELVGDDALTVDEVPEETADEAADDASPSDEAPPEEAPREDA